MTLIYEVVDMQMNKYCKGSTHYTYCEQSNSFKHCLDDDYHLFIIWQNGRSFEKEIIETIALDFEVISTISLTWSDKNIEQSFNRLYKAINNPHISAKAETMGTGEFICLVVKDSSPKYSYRKTVSGAIELVNSRTVQVKRKAREFSGDYFVHSSASPEEFYEQAMLLFGSVLLQKILNGQCNKLSLEQNLVGTNGWKDFSELFEVLNASSKYIVLRNFEFLPDDFFENDKDVDILCENVIDFISSSNARVLEITEGGAKLIITIDNKDVPFDIRFVGDNYYCDQWSRDMLLQRVRTKHDIFRPRVDDYFFSLLYHSVLQKSEVKPSYINHFEALSKSMDFDFFDMKKINEKKYIASIIEGFFVYKRYKYTKPKDSGVYVNYSVLKHISKEYGGKNGKRVHTMFKRITPRKIIDNIPSSIKININKLIG